MVPVLRLFLVVQLQPRIAYLIMAVNVGVYAAGLVSGLIDGNDAQQDYFLALAKTDAGVEAGEYYRQAPQQLMTSVSVLQRHQSGIFWVMQTLLFL